MEYITVDGIEVPALGFGTARMDKYDEQYRAVSMALETGYRHIDTAQMYDSEEAVGDAIMDADIERIGTVKPSVRSISGRPSPSDRTDGPC